MRTAIFHNEAIMSIYGKTIRVKEAVDVNGVKVRPGDYIAGVDIDTTSMKVALLQGQAEVISDDGKTVPDNKAITAAPENKLAVGSGDSSSAGPLTDAGSSVVNPLAPSDSGKRRGKAGSKS